MIRPRRGFIRSTAILSLAVLLTATLGVSANLADSCHPHLAVSFARDTYPSLDERYASTPLSQLPFYPDDPGHGWDLDWEQDFALVGIGMGLQPVAGAWLEGLLLAGTSRGHFRAVGPTRGTTEEWDTHWDDAWGWRVALVLDPYQPGGLYTEIRWQSLDAGAAEDEEFLTGPHREPGPEPYSDVYFDWSDELFSSAIGWRFARWAPAVGFRHHRTRIAKTITTHYPAGEDPVHDVLNTAPASYRYENTREWVPFLSVSCALTPACDLTAEATLSPERSISGTLAVRF